MVLLNIVSEFSLLQSLIKLDDLISFAKKNNINTLGLCDNDLYGSIEFFVKCKANNIKPIIGLKVVLDDKDVCLYAKNYLGYQKLIAINNLKNKNALTYDEINDENISIVLPYKSLDIYVKFKNISNIYLGYQNESEKENVLRLNKNILYHQVIRTLKSEDIKYLKYLNDLGGNFSYEESEFANLNISKEDISLLEKFSQLFNLEIPFNQNYIPKYKENVNSYDFLENLAYTGLKKRLKEDVNDKYLSRLKEELKVINDMGFTDYFLIVYDYVLYAKKNNILVGPGRGSAAGSLVSYSIGITDIDPVKYDLLFARFLNPYRQKMPDIDIDFPDNKRSEIISYVQKRYGKESVALGLTFNNYKSKLILRDLAKVMHIEGNNFEKFVTLFDASLSLKDNFKNKDIAKYINTFPKLKELCAIALHLEGLKKNTSTHAAGVIISSVPLDKVIPISFQDDILKTGVELDGTLEKMGLLKMDFLSLRNLSVIESIASKIPNFNLNDIPLDDPKVYELYSSGQTSDIFQFESNYAINALKKIKPQNFNELAIAIALVRPGPSNEMDTYIHNKENGYTSMPFTQDVLKETYGVIIYQEQVIKILETVGGYSPYEADNIRSAISKKKEEVILKEEQTFIQRAMQKGLSKEESTDLFNKIKKFAQYGFNKAHSVSYAKVSYIIAYLKVNFPQYFAIANLDSSKDTFSRKKYLSFIKQSGVSVLKPNINLSTNDFMYKNNRLLLPLKMIKGINDNFVNDLIALRTSPFKDIYDFMYKTNSILKEDIYKALALTGCLDVFNYNKKTLINSYEVLKNYADLKDVNLKPMINELSEYSSEELFNFENEYFGFMVSNHPSFAYQNYVKIKDLTSYLFKNIKMVLLVEKISKIKTKKGEEMAFVLASDETGQISLAVFPNKMSILNDVRENMLIECDGKASKRFDKYEIIINNIKRK